MNSISQHSTSNIQPPIVDQRAIDEKLGALWRSLSVEGFVSCQLKIVPAILFALTLFAVCLPAQPPPAKPSTDRYLFIVETSSGMGPRSAAAQKAVNSLLLSGMNAQLRKGDTIGVWTYNDQLHAGLLPLQYWTPEGEQVVASNIVSFLKGQRFEKEARFNAVLPVLQPLVKESERLTVVLISDGTQKISGTPYDRAINEYFHANAEKQEQERMPFVTVLRSYRGEYAGMTLNVAPWPVAFPPFPPKPKVAATPKPQLKTNAPPPAPPPTAPPLIVIGKKPETQPMATPTETAATTPAPTTRSQAGDPPATTSSEKPVDQAKPTHRETEPVVVTPKAQPVPPSAASPGVGTAQPDSSHDSASASVSPESTPSTHAAYAKPEPSQPATTELQTSATLPAQLATSSQPENVSKPKTLLIICAALLILVIALLIVRQRRARAATGTSLITRSMEKDGK